MSRTYRNRRARAIAAAFRRCRLIAAAARLLGRGAASYASAVDRLALEVRTEAPAERARRNARGML